MYFIFYFLLAILGLLTSCGTDNNSSKIQEKILAKVGKKQLSNKDLIGFVPLGTSKIDSAEMVRRYVDTWVRKQLLLNKAEKEVKINEAEIERKLQDYKYDLIAYQFEKNYIQKNLDTSIKNEEIKKYYQENAPNFELKQNIIKGIWLKIQKDNPEKEKVKKMLNQPTLEINSLKKIAIDLQVSLEEWIEFESFVKNTPFQSIANKTNFIQSNRFAESTEQDYTYYMVIQEYKITNQPSPLEFVKKRIESMILNQRKVQLLKNLEKNIFEEAKKNKQFEIFK
jgi:hypothetical protein